MARTKRHLHLANLPGSTKVTSLAQGNWYDLVHASLTAHISMTYIRACFEAVYEIKLKGEKE